MRMTILLLTTISLTSLKMSENTYKIQELGFLLKTERVMKILGPFSGTYIWISNSENKNTGGIWRRNNKFNYEDFKHFILTHNGANNSQIISENGNFSIHKVQEDDKVYFYKYFMTGYYNFVFWGINEKEIEDISKSFIVEEEILDLHYQKKIDYPFNSDSVVTFFESDTINRNSTNIFTINIDREIYNEPYIMIYDATLYTREKNIYGIGNIPIEAKEITIKISSSDSTGIRLFNFEKTYKVK